MKSRVLFFLAIASLGFTNGLPAQGLPSVTFLNPTPEGYEAFGAAVSAVGADKVAIATPYHDTALYFEVGAAYVFNTNGAFITSLNNPSPTNNSYFGWSVGGVGTDKVVVGSPGNDTGATDSGIAYLFTTSGTLLTPFNNPSPAIFDAFGSAVAGVGTDKVIIGAHGNSSAPGVAHLFNTSGTFLLTFNNPTPASADGFGGAVAGFGTDRVLIGASLDNTGATDAGAAYIFNLSGTLLATFTNPTPANADGFGVAVSAVGTDKVLIGAWKDDTGATDAGAAYLFNTNGTLLTTFTNPTPATADYFGIAVTGVGADKVLIGARNDSSATNLAGAAYLYSTDGTLLTTITNPTPAYPDYFGNAVAAVGPDKILIAAYGDSTTLTSAGAAYLYNIKVTVANVSLRIFRTNANAVAIAWPASSTGWRLQSNTNLATANWPDVTNAVNGIGGENQVIISAPSANKYFRLVQP